MRWTNNQNEQECVESFTLSTLGHNCRHSQVLEVRMRDSRAMSGSSAAIQSHLAASEARLAASLRAVLFRSAPSARR